MSKTYAPAETNKRFYIPPTLASDFTEFLDNDIPNTVMDFTVFHDWYDQFDDGYEPLIIRGELYPDTSKSRYTNTDNNMNIRCDVDSGIRKGDILIDENGKTYILDWEVSLQSNNAPSRALRCNMLLTIKRWQREVTDEEGYLIEDSGWKTICEDLPSNAYRYDGRPEYSAVANTPGVTPNALTLMTVQYNDKTKDIHVDDRFQWGNDIYEVVDVNLIGLSIDGTSGCITLQAKKAAGGLMQ